VSNVTNMHWMFRDCHAFHQVLPWKLHVHVETEEMFVGSHGSLLERRSPGTIRRRNEELAHSIIKRSNHPNMMRIDDDHFSPIEADAPDYTRRLMMDVLRKSPDLLKVMTQEELNHLVIQHKLKIQEILEKRQRKLAEEAKKKHELLMSTTTTRRKRSQSKSKKRPPKTMKRRRTMKPRRENVERGKD